MADTIESVGKTPSGVAESGSPWGLAWNLLAAVFARFASCIYCVLPVAVAHVCRIPKGKRSSGFFYSSPCVIEMSLDCTAGQVA